MNNIFCKCGCGNQVAKAENKFLIGHNVRMQIPWNKGLTSELDERIKNSGVKRAANALARKLKNRNFCKCGCGDLANFGRQFLIGHAWKGKHHKASSRKLLSIANKKPEKPMNFCLCGCQRKCKNKFFRGHDKGHSLVAEVISKKVQEYYNKGGKSHIRAFNGYFVSDLGHKVRSLWEENICRIFLHLEFKYIYEPKRFALSDGTSYLPDLFIPDLNLYVEIKGGRGGDYGYKAKKFFEDGLGDMWLIDVKKYKYFMDTFGNELGLKKGRKDKQKTLTGCDSYF